MSLYVRWRKDKVFYIAIGYREGMVRCIELVPCLHRLTRASCHPRLRDLVDTVTLPVTYLVLAPSPHTSRHEPGAARGESSGLSSAYAWYEDL